MLLYVSVLNEKVVLDLNQDFDLVPVQEARRLPTSRQVEVLKYLLEKKVLHEDSILDLDVKEHETGKIVLPVIRFTVRLQRTVLLEEELFMAVTIFPDGDTKLDHFGVVYTAPYHRSINRTLDRTLLVIQERHGALTYDR